MIGLVHLLLRKRPRVTKVEIGTATLYLADCREVIPTIGQVHALVTDPPYGVGLGSHKASRETRSRWLSKKAYASYDDTEENLLGIVIPAISAALKIAERGVVFCADRHMWSFPPAATVGGVYLPAACGRNRWGFASLAHCLFYGEAPDLHMGAKATALASTEPSEKNGHPCPKPVGWMKWALHLSTRPGETVLDPFMGSGTTGVAAMKMGRKFIGVELDPTYFEIACGRIEAALAQPDMLMEPMMKQESLL